MKQPMICALPQVERQATPLALADALDRFQAEAVHDVHDTGRYRCPYYVWGEGAPLVFIHGLADDAGSFVLPIARLSEHFQCIAYNLPVGKRDGARLAKYRHDDLVADLYSLMDQLDLDRAYLYGSSFGSTIALKALAEKPQRFPRAILQGGFAYRRLASAERMLVRLGCFLPGSMYWFPFRQATLHHEYRPSFAHCEPAVWDYFVERACQPPMATLARRGLLLDKLDLRPLLPTIRQPILMICGDRDPLVNRACEEDLLHGLSNASRVRLQDCGHYPYFTHPEELAESVQRFLMPLPCERLSG